MLYFISFQICRKYKLTNVNHFKYGTFIILLSKKVKIMRIVEIDHFCFEGKTSKTFGRFSMKNLCILVLLYNLRLKFEKYLCRVVYVVLDQQQNEVCLFQFYGILKHNTKGLSSLPGNFWFSQAKHKMKNERDVYRAC